MKIRQSRHILICNFLSFSALNDDKWHNMDMFINTTSGELTLSLDDYTKVTYLKSYTRQDYTTLLDWSQQSSAIYFGGEYDRQDGA